MSIKDIRGPGGHRQPIAIATALLAATVGLSGCTASTATSADSSSVEGKAADQALQVKIGELNFDLTKYCGDKPMKIGNITGFGGNTWTLEQQALVEKFKTYCPNITEIQTYDAQGDATKFNNTLNAWAAQGFNVAYATSGVFGTQTLPAFRSAQTAGMTIGVSNASLGDDVVPTTVAASVVQSFTDMGSRFVKFLDDAKPQGTSKVLLIGGTAGNTFDPPVLAAMKKSIDETGADVELLQDIPVVGNWDIAASTQVAASVLSTYPEIDGIVLTNAVVASGVIRAFQNAGRPIPAITGTGISSGVVCELTAARQTNPNINMMTLDASGNVPALALAKAIAAYQGIDAPELGPNDSETYVNLATYVDTLNGQIPECDPSLPADADPTMALTSAEINAAVR